MACVCIQLIFFTVFLFPFCASADNINGNVTIGSNLTATETSSPWLSPSGDFAFGFQQLQEKDQFLLSIWYHKIQNKTIVWYVKSINPVQRGSTVKLDAQTGLVLCDPQGLKLWGTDGFSNQVDHGFMNDTGNFILKGSDDSWLWESFNFPVDTILPYQELVIGKSLNSRQSEKSFSQGRFYLHFQDNGNLVLATRSVPTNKEDDAVYYNSDTSDAAYSPYPGYLVASNSLNSGYRVIFDSRGSMYIKRRNNDTKQLIPLSILPASENYHRATLDFDGVFTHYSHPRNLTGNPNWSILWSMPDNICLSIKAEKGSGACGFNNICSIKNRRPVCDCPKGYIPVDPDDVYGSCTPNSSLSFGEVVQGSAEKLFDFEVLSDIDWPLSDLEQINPSNETFCRQSCLRDCFCAVAIFRDNSCWKKKLPLSNGRVDTNLNTQAFIKYRKSDAPPMSSSLPPPSARSKPKDRGTLVLVGSVLLSSSLLMNLIFIAIACLGFYHIYRKKKVIFHRSTDAADANLRYFAYKELAEATNGFKEELGRGSFGIVHKGELQISSINVAVAVKKLDRMDEHAEKEFRAEVNTIGQTNHKNLVRLLGFCDERQHRLLVYEYMSHGTVARLLLQTPKPSWSLRTGIAIGISRGLVYLHEECSTQIIHCDIKPQNILLDENFNARISDFGLAKLMMFNQSRTITNIRGTKGYVAPEWFRGTQITAKVDVYSFGVLLLEIISCRRSIKDLEIGDGEDLILTDWAWDCFKDGRLDTFVENDLEALNHGMMLERFLMVGIWCIQENSSLRPTMRKVNQMLEGIVEVMMPPCPCPFSTPGGD